MRKKLLMAGILTLTMVFGGCANSVQDSVENTTEVETTELADTGEVIDIVVTSFHEYDWMKQILGEEADHFNLTLLIDDGVDLHSYEPTVEDIAAIASSELFVYNGGDSDAWVADILEANTGLNTINVIEVLDDNVQMSVVVEGMEADEHDHDHDDEETTEEDHDHDDEETTEEDHDHDDEETTEEDHDHDHDDETTEEEHDHDDEEDSHTDEHVWLSLDNAAIVCAHFAIVLGDMDGENASTYEENAIAYTQLLNELDEEYEAMVSSAARDTIIVVDRFPFLYLASDYGINYYAAFEGCSAETEASFETIIFLAEKVDEYNVNYVLTVENGLTDLATTVINNSSDDSREILELNSMQSVTQADIEAGVTYYSIMEENLEILRIVLGE